MSELDYRTQFIADVMSRHGRRTFDSMIDFGCHDGRIFESLAVQFAARRAVGVDFHPPTDRSTEKIEYVKGNFFDFTPEEPFQLVTSIQVFEHIFEPWLPKYFAALKRSCASGGMILITTPNRWRPSNLVRAMSLRKPFMMNANPGIPGEEHLGHHRECSYREMAAILDRFFPLPEWQYSIERPMPRPIGSSLRWTINLAVYAALWWAWRPLCVSASHDHYVVIQRL